MPEIMETLIAQAKSGDATSARLALERCLPITKPVDRPAPVEVSGVTLADKGHRIAQQVADGEPSPSQATELLEAMASLAKVVEMTELIGRIEALEKQAAEQDRDAE